MTYVLGIGGRSRSNADPKGGGDTNKGATGKPGMAGALEELTKRSTYFIQIQEDVKKYSSSIKALQAELKSVGMHMPMEPALVMLNQKVRNVYIHLLTWLYRQSKPFVYSAPLRSQQCNYSN